MKQDVKDRWVAALRSGEYEQATKKLRKPGAEKDSFCCLGVLCELAVQDEVINPVIQNRHDRNYYYGGQHSVLPPDVVRWAELPNDNPMVEYELFGPDRAQHYSLAELNDNGCGFGKIADVIEEQL